MSMIQEFKNFALKGNVMDLAIGVIIGGAFSTIVNSIVKDLIMPVVGLATGGLDFSNLFIRLGHVPATFKGNPDSYKDLQTAGIAVFGYGAFITVLINFIILAFIIFLMVKFINNLHKTSPDGARRHARRRAAAARNPRLAEEFAARLTRPFTSRRASEPAPGAGFFRARYTASVRETSFSSRFFVAREIAGLLLRLVPSEPPQVFGMIRARGCISGDTCRRRRAAPFPNRREPTTSMCYKRSTSRRARREWPHEDAAFLAILFQANFYVLPEKA